MEAPPEKTAKQLEKEAKKQAKLDKFKQKQDKKEKTAPAEDASSGKKHKERKTEVKKDIVYTIDTPAGERKDVEDDWPGVYSPRFVEAAWYPWWQKQGYFKPEYRLKSLSQAAKHNVFTIIIPPPNVTGSLHLGHALTNSIQDAIVRWHRMRGETVLWNPGCDHAGIATQVVVEKKLWREERKTRHDIGREEFIKRIWKWKEEKGERIYTQLKKMGSSYDWDRAAFTMDPKLSQSVTEAFVRLHQDGTIYRSNRLVNWSCTLKSAISDIEVDKIDLPGRTYLSVPGYEDKVEFGVLQLFAYRLVDSDEQVIVATTRVETMLGDTAVAVHPEDERFVHLHGKFVQHPFCSRKIPIITDNFVDREFGTGAVKITPAHDPNDYEVGVKHGLPFLTILDDNGMIVGDCGDFVGMKRFIARRAVLEALKAKGLYIETKSHAMVVPVCNRSKDIVEPMLKPQWYVKCDEMAANAIEVVRSGELKIIPEMYCKTWYHWMEGIRDWCISRQLWWGHRIPAYFVTIDGQPANANESECWVSGRSLDEATMNAEKKFGRSSPDLKLSQDEDVLDTWFSSALFPFSVFGWPEKTLDLQVFYPTSLLETGNDILFFWVARMVFFGQRLMGKLPFKEVFLHPIIRDAHGRKMSKSLGNVIDPMDVINGITLEDLHAQLLDSNLDPKELEKARAGQKRDFPDGIPECGTDALRFALCAMCSGRDINLDILRVQGYRFFCNKIWNASSFARDTLSIHEIPANNQLTGHESLMDLWMLSRVASAATIANSGFENYDFPTITTAIYNLWLYDLCDVYLETLKPVFSSRDRDAIEVAQTTLLRTLMMGLKLLSPFMPFITEELFQRLSRTQTRAVQESICVQDYPNNLSHLYNAEVESKVEFIQQIAKAIRSARSVYNIPHKTQTAAFIFCSDVIMSGIIEQLARPLATLSFCTKIAINQRKCDGCTLLTINDKCEVYLPLRHHFDPANELAKMQKKVKSLQEAHARLEQAMSAADYSTKVPLDVQAKNSEKMLQTSGEMQKLEAAMESLRAMI